MKLTAKELAQIVIEENKPFDYKWLRHLKRTYSSKELRDWAKQNIEYFAPIECSKALIGRASSILLQEVFSKVC